MRYNLFEIHLKICYFVSYVNGLTQPLQSRDWEIHINFKVHSPSDSLFGDGFAFWYTEEPIQEGELVYCNLVE